MTENDLHEYNKWLMEVWNPNQIYIPFVIDAPKAYLDYRNKHLKISDENINKINFCNCYNPEGTPVNKVNLKWMCDICKKPLKD